MANSTKTVIGYDRQSAPLIKLFITVNNEKNKMASPVDRYSITRIFVVDILGNARDR